MHSSGEKTNPGPIGKLPALAHCDGVTSLFSLHIFVVEHIISKHPAIKRCLMFGRERFQTGIMIQPMEEEVFNPMDLVKLAAFRNEIWSVTSPVTGSA